ncbi:hypothetical protein PSYJA_46096, partial [Pseudomonas syringae pv. japonica str. M301072]
PPPAAWPMIGKTMNSKVDDTPHLIRQRDQHEVNTQ